MVEPSLASDAHPDSKKRARSLSDASISCHSLPLHEGTRMSKRLRTNSSKALERPEVSHPQSPEIVYERRRVNPDSLAIRLGPELVSELNALILPGNRDMPSFAIRKELQERYNIDRRHLYDYFHSKGLRVVKEDKNGNPIRQTDQPTVVTQPTLRMLRQAPPKATVHHHDLPSISSDTKHKMSRSALKLRASKQGTIRLKKPDNPPKPIAKRSHSPSHSSAEQHYSQTEQVYSKAQPFVPSSFVPSHFFTNPLQNYFVYSADEDVSKVRTIDEFSSHSPTSVFEKMIAQEHMESRLRSPDPLALSHKPSMRTDRQHMSQEERIAFYDFVDSVLGPPCGVQESVGTYKTYMAEQSRLYFERILPGSHDHMLKVQAQTYVRSQSASQAQSSTDSVDFRKWLASDGSADSSLDDQRSPAPHYSPYGARASDVILANSRSNTTGPAEGASYGVEDDFSGTLDDLFPDVNGNGNSLHNEAMGSPVERSVPKNWNDFVLDEDDIAISPTRFMGSPSTQQTSPDIQSSPFIETPTSVYQQFIQHKNPYFGMVYSSQTAQWTPTLQNDAMYHSATLSESPRPRFQDDDVVQKNRGSEDMFKYTARSLSIRNTLHPTQSEIARIRTRSSGIHVARMRTSSAGGGI